MSLSLQFGALAPKIAWQVANQGFRFVRSHVRQAQRDADAVTRLLIRGLMNEAQAKKARQKIVCDVAQQVKP